MSRDDGFMRADIDVTMFDDLKFRRLWRELGHQGYMAEASTIYIATVLRSWHDGQIATAEESVPMWLNPSPEAMGALVAVGLLDKDHRVPKRVFDAWIRPAWERRERYRFGGRMTADRRWPTQPAIQPTNQPEGLQASYSPAIAPLPAIDPQEIPPAKRLRRKEDGTWEESA